MSLDAFRVPLWIALASAALASCAGVPARLEGGPSAAVASSAPPVDAITLQAAAQVIPRTETLLYTDDFESSASQWTANWWDGSVPNSPARPRNVPGPIVASDASPANAHGGLRAGRFRFDAPTMAVFKQAGWVFEAGARYRVTAWVKTDAPADIELMLRGAGPGYFAYALRQLAATTYWQQVDFEGITTEAGTSLFLNVPQGVTAYLDDIKVYRVIQDELSPRNKVDPIAATMFGVHVNRLGTFSNWPRGWPKLGQTVLRLHDTGTHWFSVEPRRGEWNFARLDLYVDGLVRHNDPEAEIIYTMGFTPTWASRTPSLAGPAGKESAGSTAPPANFADWRNYVDTVGRRYQGKIKYWEIWNEWDIPDLYSGDVGAMVELTRIAREVLRAIDTNNVIVAPSVTARVGTLALERFLRAGGGQYVDIINMHLSGNEVPEKLTDAVSNIRAVMEANGVGDKPLWNTEGAFGCDPTAEPGCRAAPIAAAAGDLTAADLGWPVRHHLLLWTKGVSNFNYYHWEGFTAHQALVYGLWEHGTKSNCRQFDASFPDYNPNCPTPLGAAYAKAIRWLKGASVSEAYVNAGRSGRIFVFKMMHLGQLRVVLWTTGADEVVRFPDDLRWTELTFVSKLDGSKTVIPTDRGVPSAGKKFVTVFAAPILLTVD